MRGTGLCVELAGAMRVPGPERPTGTTWGATTTQTYDPLTFRLATLVTERVKKAGSTGTLRQDRAHHRLSFGR